MTTPMNSRQSWLTKGAILVVTAAGSLWAVAGSTNAPVLPIVDEDALDIGACRAPTSHSRTDRVLTCSCPAENYDSTSVWGTDTYTADSYICTAARHAGVITNAGGRVTLQMRPGQARYVGSHRNGITTRAYGSYHSSYRFVRLASDAPGSDAPSPNLSTVPDPGRPANTAGQIAGILAGRADNRAIRDIANATAAVLDGNAGPVSAGAQDVGQCHGATRWRESATPLTCICPADFSLSAPVWGTDVYSADSYICKAAQHAGLISRTGGRVTFHMLPDQSSYRGSRRNGVTTLSHGATNQLGAYRFIR